MKHKKCIRKLLSFLTILCCLAGSITPVHASGTGSGSSVPRVTVTNEPVNSPDLYVTKTVENALEGAEYEAPAHAVFRFVLKQNGQIAKNVTYRVLDPDHGEIVRRTSLGMSYPFQTDQTGVFTLEAGQQAWFEGLGTGSRYEVIEQDTYLRPVTDDQGAEETVENGYKLYYGDPEQLLHAEFRYETRSLSEDGWQKKSPSGGSSGEHGVLPNGSYETFTNRYIGKGTGDTTVLEVTKSTSFPNGYQAPDTTPAFPFVIELDGAPYANEPFTAVNEKTGETRSLVTDGEGRFTLPGGWTARFEEVPVDVDYRVYEDTEAADEGAEELPEEPPIRDTEMGLLSLERAENVDVSEESGAGTDGETSFADPASADMPQEETGVSTRSLLPQAGQSTGDLQSRAGSAGSARRGRQTGGVSDTGSGPFVWPEGWWPVQDTVRTGATQSPLTALNFHNSNVSFVVTKRLEDYSTPEDIWFEFRLADENNDALGGVIYYVYNTNGEPVYPQQNILAANRNPVVEVDGKQIQTGMTDMEGGFYLAPGEAAVFIGLEPGTSYRVSEIKNPEYTQIMPDPSADNLYTVAADGQISTIDFVNRPESMDGVLTVTKTVAYGSGEGELSADEFHFILYKQLTEEAAKELLGGTTEDKIRQGLRDGKIILAAPDSEESAVRPGPDVDMGSEMGLSDTGLSPMSADAPEEDQNISSSLLKAGGRALEGGTSINRPLVNLWFARIGGKFYEVYAPAEEMLFSIPEGLETPSYKTGSYKDWKRPGEFALKAGQTARFEEKVSAGDGYLVMEVDLSEEYEESLYGFRGHLREGHRVVYGMPEENTIAPTGVALAGLVTKSTAGSSLSLAFENIYVPRKIDLVLTKTDGNNEVIADREAHFMLYRTQGKDSPVLPDPLPDGTDADTFVYRTENGVLRIPNLKAGTYWLYEVKAPSGYALLPKPVQIDLTWTADGLTVTIDGKPYRGPADAGTVTSDVLGAVAITPPREIEIPGGELDLPEDAESRGVSIGDLPLRPLLTNTEVSLSIRNTQLYELPNSGGMGIYWYSIGGTLLMLAAALILYRNKRQGRC